MMTVQFVLSLLTRQTSTWSLVFGGCCYRNNSFTTPTLIKVLVARCDSGAKLTWTVSTGKS